MADYSLLVNVEAIDKASAVFDKISKNVGTFKKDLEGAGSSGSTSMQGLGQSMQSVGNTMTSTGKVMTATVTAPVVALGTAAVKTAADFDTQMSKVKAISGATGDDMDALRAKAREMGAKTKFSATEAGQGFEYMAMAGWKTGDMLDGIEGIMNLAAASGENLGTTSDIVTDALTAFGLSAKDSGHFADVLAAASTNANTNVSMLGESFKYAAPVVGALGGTSEDTSIALGLMANAGIKASQAGTSLRTGLSNMAKPTKQMQAYMDKYNISLKTNADGSVNLRETMISLRENMQGLSTTEQAAAASAIFGKNAMSGWLAIINASDADFNKLTSAIDGCDGAAKDMADTMNDNLEGQLTILKSQLQELAISFGEILIPTVRSVVTILQNIVDWFNKIPEPMKEVITKVLALAAVIGPFLIVGGKLVFGIGKLMTLGPQLSAAFTMIKAAGVALGGGLQALWAILMANPIILVIAAVAALVAGFIYLWNTSEEFRNFWIGLWEGIKSVVSAAWTAITTALTTAWTAISTFFQTIWTAIQLIFTTAVTGIKTFLAAAWTAIRTATTTAWNAIKTVILTAWNAIRTTTTTIMEAIKAVLSNAWNAIRTTVSTAMGNIRSAVSSGLSAAHSAASNMLNSIKNTFTSVFNGIRSHVSGVVSWLKGIFNFSWSLPHISLPHFSISGSFSLNPPSVPHFSVSWYKSAYDEALMFQAPTVFGASGFGDGNGSEVVVGDNHLIDLIREAFGGGNGMGTGDIIVPVYIGQERVDEIVVRAAQRQALLSGGR